MIRVTTLAQALLAGTALLAPAALAQETTAPATTAPAADAPLPPAATDAPRTYDAATVVARVNGTEITLGLLVHIFQSLPEQYQGLPGDVLLPALLEQLINQHLLADEGRKAGLGDRLAIRLAIANTGRDALAGAFVQDILATEVTEERIAALYAEKVAGLPPEQEVNASHILVETEEKAKDILARLAAGTAFEELAKESIDGASGAQGGLLGWFGRGMMVPAFEEAVFALAAGQVSAPVQTQFGWHVIRLNEVREKPKPTLEEVRGALVNELSEATVRARIEALRAAAAIEKPELAFPMEAIKDTAILAP